MKATCYRFGSKGACVVELSAEGLILSSSAVSCPFSGTVRFDAWFRAHYPAIVISKDGGLGYHLRRKRAENQPQDTSASLHASTSRRIA